MAHDSRSRSSARAMLTGSRWESLYETPLEAAFITVAVFGVGWVVDRARDRLR